MSEETAPPAEGEAKAASKGPKGIVLIGALAGGLLLGAAGGLFALGPMLAKKSGYVVHPDSLAADSSEAEAATGGHEGGKEGEAAASTVYLIDNVILNPAGSGGTRFLMLATAVDAKDATVVEQMKARDAETRDVLLRVMGSKTVEQLADMRFREDIKKELTDSLGALFKKGAIRRIYFPQYVIQ
ncbi:MAG: flagellar basal body-associated FliL family protein [Gemmatimonadaceae bacterium]